MVRKNSAPIYITSGIYIPYFLWEIVLRKVGWTSTYPTCFISGWEKVKEIWDAISIVVWCQESFESTCKWNPHTFSHGDLPERHIVSFTPSDLRIASQPFITYAFVITIYLYDRFCVACSPPSTFSHICSRKKERNWLVYIFSFRYMQKKIICRTDLSCDPHNFVTQSGRRRCAWLSKFFRAGDHFSGAMV